jgi:hypothetical protein
MTFKSELRFKKVHDGYIVFIYGREGHAHFRSARGCQKLIRLISHGRLPKESYFRNAAKRILTDDEYESLTSNHKPEYINIGKKAAK